MRYLKVIALVCCLFLTAGWKWSDVAKDFNGNITCEYQLDNSSAKSILGFEKIKITADSSKMLMSFDGKEYDIKNSPFSGVLGNDSIYFHGFSKNDAETFFNEYTKYSTCPKNIYVTFQAEVYKVHANEQMGDDATNYSFTSISSNNNNSNNNNNNGTNTYNGYSPASIGKYKIYKYKMPYTYKDLYVELGFQKLSNGTIERYVALADNESMSNAKMVSESTSKDLLIYFDGDSYTMPNKDSLFSYNNGSPSFIATEKFRISGNADGSGHYMYYIDSSDNEAYGGISNNKPATDVIPDYKPVTPEKVNTIVSSKLDPTAFCTKTSPIWQIAGYIFFVFKILVPILIIVLASIDFAKASFAGDDKTTSATFKKLVSRVIIGIAIFAIPSLISFILSSFSEISKIENYIDGCQVCLLRPTSSECKEYKATAKSTVINK